MKKVSTLIRIMIGTVAFLFLVWVNLDTAFNAGRVLGIIVFSAVIAVCVFWRRFCTLVKQIWGRVIGKIALLFFTAAICACVAVSVIFSVNMMRFMEVPVEDARAVLVLGCQVKGEQPSRMLQGRLNAALEILNSYSEAVCVVSGGRGNGEDISEAEAMRRYLEENGISADRIIIEDDSYSTRENIKRTSEILKEKGLSDGIIIVTNEFHQYRAELYARKNGLSVGHHSSRTNPPALASYWLREWLALLSAVLVG